MYRGRNCFVQMWLILVFSLVLAGYASAGEISDHVSLGDGKGITRHSFTGLGRAETLTGRIGTVDEKMPCLASGPKSGDSFQIALQKSPGKSCVVQIQEVYPPESEGVRYAYEVYANKKLVYIRDYPGIMFSRVSYFVKLDDPASVKAPKITLRFVNRREGAPFRVSAIWLYSDFDAYCRDAGFGVPFYLTPLLSGRGDDLKLEAEYRYLNSKLRRASCPDVKLGCSTEHHYMHRDQAAAKQEFETYLRLSRKYDMPIAFLYVSWWGGTPMWKPDGKGGQLSDPEYQQICWSETDTYDEGPELRKLLGDRWDIRYGFTTPNMWSNTPWLTMNHPVLNAAKFEAIGRNLGALADVMKQPGAGKHLIGLAMENEPRYWDLVCPDQEYPVKREDLMADFNPVTVADAAKDGVNLDPKGGLDFKERLWLHENVARYQQKTYDAHAGALRNLDVPYRSSDTDALWHDVYSHAFTGPAYPMKAVTSYHPLLEWNRLAGCRTGLEEVAQPETAYLDVTREWGRWSQVNYEENNGRGTEWHLRTLRACYAFGARFHNFYNWQSINGDGKWTEYVQAFCHDKPISPVFERKTEPAASFVRAASHAFSVEVPPDRPLVSLVAVNLDTPGEYVLMVYNGAEKERLLGYRRMLVAKAGVAQLDLPNSAPVGYGSKPCFVIERADRKPFGLMRNPSGDPVVSLYSDSRRERMQSLLISWRADAESLISELSAKRSTELAAAQKLFDKGEYREAYEEAVRVERGRLTSNE
jgi:hypothetical protein